MIDPSIPRVLSDAVDRELVSGEYVDWMGMPRRVYFTPVSIGAFLFGIPWTAFSVFWVVAAGWGTLQIDDGPGIFSLFPLFGVPFVLLGCCMLSVPLWTHWRAGKTVYAITNQRAIIFDGGWSTTIRSYPPEELTDIFRKEKADGSGDVIIARRAWRDSDGGRQTQELGFFRVADAKDVEDRIKELAEQ